MKTLSIYALGIMSMFFVQGCGKVERFDSYEVSPKLCDPQDNPGACPTNLHDDAVPSRTLQVGSEDTGIRVDNPNNENMFQTCRQTKLSLLERNIEPEASYNGLHKGEFVANASFAIVSEGSDCVRRNIFRSCTKHLNYARIVCKFELQISPSLK